MISVSQAENAYLARFAQLEHSLAGNGHAWVGRLREEAMHRFAELGFPTTRLEDWKQTNVAPLVDTPFQPAPYLFNAWVRNSLRDSPWFKGDTYRITFINGHFCPQLSSESPLPYGIRVGSLASALREGDSAVEEHLGRYASSEHHAFVALNTAFIADGAFIAVPRGIVAEKPIHLLFATAPSDEPTVSHPRNLILVGRGSEVTLIESYLNLGEGVYFTNAVTEIVADENAVVRYAKTQRESDRAFHIATVQFSLGRAANVTSFSGDFGGRLVREEVNGVLAGEGSEFALDGLYVATGAQHIDNHTTIDHAQPHCASREVYKGILDGKARGVFNGKIMVRKDAQKTDAKQSNRNLLLSAEAQVNTKPQLEIYADDVKCTHGATVGQLDSEALFYLRSRGISQHEARALLTYAFANEVIDRVTYEPLRARVRESVFTRLAGG